LAIITGDNHHRQLWDAISQKAYDALTGKVSAKAEINDSDGKMLDRQCLHLRLGIHNQSSEALGHEQVLDLEGEKRFIVHDEGQRGRSVAMAHGFHGRSNAA
jgi:hypothetical protein